MRCRIQSNTARRWWWSISSKEQAEDVAGACPTCGETIPEGAAECPKCLEALAVEKTEEPEVEKAPEGRNYLFYIGLILVIMGGPGIALGSWLHDLLKIPFPAGYDNWESFGWVNRMTSAGGIIVLLVGMLLLALSITRSRALHEDEDEI